MSSIRIELLFRNLLQIHPCADPMKLIVTVARCWCDSLNKCLMNLSPSPGTQSFGLTNGFFSLYHTSFLEFLYFSCFSLVFFLSVPSLPWLHPIPTSRVQSFFVSKKWGLMAISENLYNTGEWNMFSFILDPWFEWGENLLFIFFFVKQNGNWIVLWLCKWQG